MTWKGWEGYVPATAPTARSKYGNKAVMIDGLRFDSKREAARYQVLKMRLAAGEIRGLILQPKFGLSAWRSTGESIAEYVADFEYYALRDEHWFHVVEDVKGHRTEIYKLKKKWFEAQYGITILET